MWLKHLNMYIATTCVSFTLIVVLFSVLSPLVYFIGPTSPNAVLLLLSMCLIISAFTTWLGSLELRSTFVFYLLCYVACMSTVLGLGYVTDFIPLQRTNATMNWTVLAMITAVFLGTATFRIIWEKNAVSRINARLRSLRNAAASAEEEACDLQIKNPLINRYLYTSVTSYTALMPIVAAGDILGNGITTCNTRFALTGFAVCLVVSAIVVAMERASSSSWRIFLTSTALGAAISDALLMPAGTVSVSWEAAVFSVAVSAAVSLLTAGALWCLDGLEAQDINERIQERRKDDEQNHRGRGPAKKIR